MVMKTYNNNAKLRNSILCIMAVFSSLFSTELFAQANGKNFDFNYGPIGNYAYWRGYQGTNNSQSGTTIAMGTWTPYNDPSTCMHSNVHTFVINSDVNATDAHTGGLLKKVPSGYKRSTQINCENNNPDANANKLSYDLAVADSNCLLTFNYAMVLEAPGHTGFQNPFFKIDVYSLQQNASGDYVTNGLVSTCATFYVVGSNNPVPAGWHSFGSSYDGGIWHDWQQVSMNLSNFTGENVRIEITLASCCYSAHWAYGYFVGKVGPAQLTVDACGENDTVVVVEAPSGFQKYEWYANPTDLSESQLSTIATGTPLYSSEATATQPANNKFSILNSIYANYGQKYFVKVTSPSSSSSIPGCVAYMKANVQSIKPNTDFRDTAYCDLSAQFTDVTNFPVDADEDANGNRIAKEYHWDFGDGDTLYYNSTDTTITDASAFKNPRHHYAAAGTYTVTLKVSYDGCVNNRVQSITIPATPSFTLRDTMICIGDQLTSSVYDRALTDATYTWRNLTTDATATGITYHGTYVDRTYLEVTSSSPSTTCTYKDTVMVDVQQFPDITLQGDTMLCLGEIANITAIDATHNTQLMQWTFSDPGVPPVFDPNRPTTQSPVLSFTPTKDTTVYLIAQTNMGCMSSKNIHIYITDPTVWANKYKVCPSQEVILHGGKAVAYSWTSTPVDSSFAANVQSTSDTIAVHPKETTVYTMKGYGTSGCFAQRTVQITVIPVPTPIISFSPAYVDVDNPIITLQDASTYGYTSHWQLSEGTESTLRSYSHQFTDVSGDSVTIYLTTTNEVNCSADTSVSVPIQLFSVWVPNAFTPNNDGVNDYFFPISKNVLVDLTFDVFNRWGKKVFSYHADKLDCANYADLAHSKGWNGQYEGKDVPKGSYAWRLTYKREGNERVYDKKGMITIIR